MDDAGGGRRGLRAQLSPELFEALKRNYGIVPSRAPVDLGGSSNLDLLLVDRGRRLVARVYRPSVSITRLGDIQRARRRLTERGFPCPVPVAASGGNDWTLIDDRLVAVADLDDEAAARAHAAAMNRPIEFALEIMRTPRLWRAAFA